MMSVMRHEGGTLLNIMAGSIKNNFITAIMNEEDVPKMYQAIGGRVYFHSFSNSWEKEAYWAGHTEGMTEALLNLVPQEQCGV